MKLAGSYTYNAEFASQIHTALCNAYSDKASSHGYHTVFAHLFEGREINNMLEIGLFLNDLQHTDLTAWAQIFPDAQIYGGDIKTEQLFNKDNIQMYYADQTNNESLNALKQAFPVEFDVIIDDASHMYGSTIATFEALFPVVKSGGIYLIEDCQSEHENNNGWQQTVSALEAYFTANGHTFETFQSLEPRKVFDRETGEPTEQDAPSDDYIICIYKS